MSRTGSAAQIARLDRDLELVRYEVFKSPAGLYFPSPGAFVWDCIDWDRAEARPADYQVESLEDLVKYGRECVRGPHGIGKTAPAAWAILWFALTRDGTDWKNPTTATAWAQLKRYLWPEVHKWSRFLRWDVIGRPAFVGSRELLDMALQLDTGESFAVASNDAERIEGAHGDHVLFMYDEAKGIPEDTWDATEGAFSGAGEDTGREAFALAYSTPGPPNGRFWAIQTKKPGYRDWHVRHVTLEEAVSAGRVSAEWAEGRKRQWGENSGMYQQRVKGNFHTDEDAVIPLHWAEAAVDRGRALGINGEHPQLVGTPTAIGLDVGDEGPDTTELAPIYGFVVMPLESHDRTDAMETVGYGIAMQERLGGGTLVVDTIGIGSGVGARLKELGRDWVAFVASASAAGLTDRSGSLGFVNLRAAAWWGMRERLDPDQGDGLALPDDDELISDLTTPRWKMTSGSKILVEPKDGESAEWGIVKRLGRSTNKGDAVVSGLALPIIRRRIGRARVRVARRR